MKKILCTLLATASIGAFATVGDTGASGSVTIQALDNKGGNICSVRGTPYNLTIAIDGQTILTHQARALGGPFSCNETKRPNFAWNGGTGTEQTGFHYEDFTDGTNLEILITGQHLGKTNNFSYLITDADNQRSNLNGVSLKCALRNDPTIHMYNEKINITIDCISGY